jgi:hypothetical protein
MADTVRRSAARRACVGKSASARNVALENERSPSTSEVDSRVTARGRGRNQPHSPWDPIQPREHPRHEPRCRVARRRRRGRIELTVPAHVLHGGSLAVTTDRQSQIQSACFDQSLSECEARRDAEHVVARWVSGVAADTLRQELPRAAPAVRPAPDAPDFRRLVEETAPRVSPTPQMCSVLAHSAVRFGRICCPRTQRGYRSTA